MFRSYQYEFILNNLNIIGDNNEEIYRRCSPITYAHLCTTPTLFLQHDEFAATVHDFYSYVGQVVARHPAFLSTSHPTPGGQESRVLLIAKRFRS